MQIKYEKTGDQTYFQWAEMMYDSGFTLSFGEIQTRLNVSRNWMNEFLQKSVHHVHFSASFKRDKKIDSPSMLFFHEQELRDWLKSVSTFSRQTRVIDLEKYKSFSVIRDAERVAGKTCGKKKGRFVYGYIDPEILEILGISFVNVNERRRSDYAATRVDPFDFWDSTMSHPSKYSSTELLYREAFRYGLVKISMLGKTIFVPLPEEDPFLAKERLGFGCPMTIKI